MLLNEKQLNQFYFLSYLLVFAGLLAYVIYKAFTCDITNDEAYSFKLVYTGYFHAMVGTANTHWLNSLAIYLFGNLFGFNSLGALRILSIGGFLIYGYAVYRFAGAFRKKSVSLATVLILLLNPFLLDYFSLARGYGLAIGLETLGLFWLIQALQAKSADYMLKALLILATGVAANYSLFYIFFCVAVFYFICLYNDKEFLFKMKQKSRLGLILGIITIVAVVTILNLMVIKNAGDLHYGSDDSFFNTTSSLVVFSSYGLVNGTTTIAMSKVMTIILISLAAYKVFRNFSDKITSPAACLGFIVLASFLTFQVLHLVAKTPFLYGRTALVLIPVYVLFLLFAADRSGHDRSRKAVLIACYLMSSLAVLNFIKAANTRYFYEWRPGADATRHLKDIYQDTAEKNLTRRPVVYLFHDYSIFKNYYSLINPEYDFDLWAGPDDKPLKDDSILTRTDYAILPVEFWQKYKSGEGVKFHSLKTYPVTKTVLVIRTDQ